ncbi:MAG: hypothetical protein ACREQY_20320 [Candidatus Binatia bacterium]
MRNLVFALSPKVGYATHQRPYLALLFLLVLSEGTAAGEVSLRQRLADLESKIRTLIGEARAERPEQCLAIAFGAKPCGGPWRYLVYSTAATDGARLETLVAEYNALDRRRNGEEGLVSDCAFVGPPALALVAGRCVGRGR